MLWRLKRFLRPFRPVLLPIWRRMGPSIESSDRRRWTDAGADLTSKRPIRPLAKREFEALERAVPYYKGRWGYISLACQQARELIDSHGLRSALELGPHIRPVIVGADVMDRHPASGLVVEGRVIVHDATKIPWPIGDKQYDLFVALQVFEHLKGEQRAAFAEVMRIARYAIVSLPIDWVMDDPTNCHHRISHERALEWFQPALPTRVAQDRTGGRKRLIYVFENLGASERKT